MNRSDSKLNMEGVEKSITVDNSFRNGTILNCFRPSIETTLLLQQIFLVSWGFDVAVVSDLQQYFTFEKTATSTRFDPQKCVSILNENVDKSTRIANTIEKTLWDTFFIIVQI